MDKKILLLMSGLAFAGPVHCDHNGGAIAAGALGGLAVGTMIGAAASSDKSERVEARLDQEQRERDQERIRELEKRIEEKELERRLEERIKTEGGYKNIFTIIILGILAAILLAMFGVGIAFLLHKKTGE
jgi:Flp pilus assembly protein TadB